MKLADRQNRQNALKKLRISEFVCAEQDVEMGVGTHIANGRGCRWAWELESRQVLRRILSATVWFSAHVILSVDFNAARFQNCN